MAAPQNRPLASALAEKFGLTRFTESFASPARNLVLLRSEFQLSERQQTGSRPAGIATPTWLQIWAFRIPAGFADSLVFGYFRRCERFDDRVGRHEII